MALLLSSSAVSAAAKPHVETPAAYPDPKDLPALFGLAEKRGTPLVERLPGNRARLTFFWRGDPNTRNVVVFSQLAGENPVNHQMRRFPGTDIWYRSEIVPSSARFTYKLSVNDSLVPLNTPNLDFEKRFATFRLDPLNRKIVPSNGKGPFARSIAEGPDAPQNPWGVRKAGVKQGALVDLPIAPSGSRRVRAYVPAGYSSRRHIDKTVILLDGESYLTDVPILPILDNLIATRAIPPTLVLFVDSGSPSERDRDTQCSQSFSDLLARTLLEAAKDRFAISRKPEDVVVAGSSRGGLAATCAGLHHPERFGNIIALSSSYYWKPGDSAIDETVTHMFEHSERLPLRFFVAVGTLETLKRDSSLTQLSSNRHFRDVLRTKHYPLGYSEFVGDHDYVNWQRPLALGMIALLAPSRDGLTCAGEAFRYRGRKSRRTSRQLRASDR